MKTYTLEQIKDIYNDYRNNYLTTQSIANDYGTTKQTIQRMFRKINLHYRVNRTTIVVYKVVSESTLKSIEYIQVNKPIELMNVKQLIQNKYPNHIINRLGQ
jgi:hypothetical protein